MTHVHVQALMKKIKHMWDDPMMVQSPRDVFFPVPGQYICTYMYLLPGTCIPGANTCIDSYSQA